MIVIATKMNIHEHQAKEILKEYGAPVSNGVVILSLDQIKEKNLSIKFWSIRFEGPDSCWWQRQGRWCEIN